MNKFYVRLKSILICLQLILILSTTFGQSKSSVIDLQKARLIIDSLDKQFSQHFYNGDSVALYAMYSEGARLGSSKGNEILKFWGKQIRDAFKNDARNIVYTTTSLSTDGEFLVELGTYEIKDSKGNLNDKGKYVVVWKQEDGTWKLYRDIGL